MLSLSTTSGEPSSDDKILTLLMCPTRACNRNCLYCYTEGRHHSTADRMTVMSEHVLSEIFKQLTDLVPQFEVVWHGGEPTLAGAEFFGMAVRHQPTGTKNRIHTNGFMKDDVLRTLQDLRFILSTSLDLPLEVNAITRREPIEQALKRIERLKAAYERIGFLCVVSTLNVGRYREMVPLIKELGAIKFNPIFGNNELRPSTQQYTEFLEFWVDLALKDEQFSFIDPISPMTASLIFGETDACRFAGNCQEWILAFDADGDAYPCQRYLGYKNYRLGNILQDGMAAILSATPRELFAQRWSLLSANECKGCKYGPLCYGGCPLEGSLTSRDFFCQSYRACFNKIARLIESSQEGR